MQTRIKKIILLSGLIFILLVSIAYSIKILGFEELRFDGALLINSTTLSIKTNNIVRMFVDSDGKVGIGTASPLQTLVVVGTVNITDSLNVSGTIEATTFIGSGSALTGISSTTSVWNSSGTNFYLNDSTGKVGIGTASPTKELHVIGNANFTGTIFVGANITGYGADYAEMFEKLNPSEKIEPGDIVAIVNGKVAKHGISSSLYMVVTDTALITGNSGKGEIPVAFVGQVKTKVSGKVREGDYILASGSSAGYAKSRIEVSFEEFKSKFVGIALESKDSKGVERINVAIGVI